MAKTLETLLNEFVDDWNAGRRPRVDQFVERAPEDERDELAGLIGAYLEVAPTPPYTSEQLAELGRDPTVEAIAALPEGLSGLWPSLLPRLRKRAKLTREQVVKSLATALGVEGSEAKVKLYYHQMETGTLEPAGVSRRVLEALGRIFAIAPSEIEKAGDFPGFPPAAAGMPYLRAGEARQAAELARMERIEFAAPAPPAAEDEVDRLFRGGR